MSGLRATPIVVVPMTHRPDLEADQADQQRAESDERWQPPVWVDDEEGDDDEAVGDEEKAGEDRSDGRPAGQRRSLRYGVATSVTQRLNLIITNQHPMKRFFASRFGLLKPKKTLDYIDRCSYIRFCGFSPLMPTGSDSYRRGAERFSAIRRDAMGTSMRLEERQW